jgi:hypothetical protein
MIDRANHSPPINKRCPASHIHSKLNGNINILHHISYNTEKFQVRGSKVTNYEPSGFFNPECEP